MDKELTRYETDIQNRSMLHYLLGLVIRWKQHFKYDKAVRIARERGAKIGEGVIMPLSLARKANKNLTIGNHVSIQTDTIDLRSPVTIGSYVIIGAGVDIITTSHDIDSLEWEHKHYGIQIDDYVWIATAAIVLPSCRKIGYGAVVGGGSVSYKEIGPMSVMSGNPAKEIRKRKNVHENLVVESLLGGDYRIYKETRARRNEE